MLHYWAFFSSLHFRSPPVSAVRATPFSDGDHVCAYERVSVFLHVVRQFRLEWIRIPCHHMKIEITQPEHWQGIKTRCSEVAGGNAKQIYTVACIAHTSGLVPAL
ncbi:unnamed protein product [Ectocarpus sp. 4 AP-2014]